jgi:hypothetical protein
MTEADKDSVAFLGTLVKFNPLFDPIIGSFQKLIIEVLKLTGALDAIPRVIEIELIRQTSDQVASSFGGTAFNRKRAEFAKQNAESVLPKEDGTGGAAAAAISPLQELLRDPARNIRADKQALKLEGAGLTKEVAKWVTSVQKPVVAAREALRKIDKKGQTYIDKLTDQYKNSTEVRAAASAASIAAAEAAERQAEALRQAEKDRIAALDQLYANFLDTIKGTFSQIRNAIQGAFDITGLGGSTNAIIRNMNKLLNKLKSFSTNVKELATMGLDPALLQQIITAGPMAGSRIASALVAGGAGALGTINAGFAQVGALASEIATTGVNSLFDTKAQQNQYNITVTGGVGSGATIGKAIVDAIKDYERTSGAVWQGA